jgi:nitroimidazol reductase NimA-like FMN-containing flavoprotein (pyridoxamine 5'-phosphate oxidase superfamily)
MTMREARQVESLKAGELDQEAAMIDEGRTVRLALCRCDPHTAGT